MRTATEVLRFWFDEHGQEDWFAAKAEFDAAIADQFTDTHAALARGEGASWRRDAWGRLAEIIVLDQFSRQIYRGKGEAFATDVLALILAQEAVAGGHHHFLPMPQRTFILLPYMHSESEIMQAESIRLHTALGPEPLKYAQAHSACVARFGRFPKRNAALGRESTPPEIEYLAGNRDMF